MEPTNGSGELYVGVGLLDSDHREMSETIAKLKAAADRGEDRSLTIPMLRKLANFTLTHFALEEGMMLATRYPRMARHCLSHQRMMERIRQIVTRSSRSCGVLTLDALSQLTELHSEHVLHDDVDYGRWLNRTPKR